MDTYTVQACIQAQIAKCTPTGTKSTICPLTCTCTVSADTKRKQKTTEGEHGGKCKGYNFPQSASAWNKQLGVMCRASLVLGEALSFSVYVCVCLRRHFISSSMSFLWLGRLVQGQCKTNSIIPPPNGPERALYHAIAAYLTTVRSRSIWTVTQFLSIYVCAPLQWILNEAIKTWIKVELQL